MKKIVCFICVLLCWPLGCLHASMDNPVLQWDRIRIMPSVSIEQKSSDNIFLEDQEEKREDITRISSSLKMDLALTKTLMSEIYYRYEYLHYSEYENFKNDDHYVSLSLKWRTAKGSHIDIGGNLNDTSVQPYTEEDQSKDYYKIKGYADILLCFTDMWEINSKYSHIARRFYDEIYQVDDFNRDSLKIGLLYRKFRRLPLLLEFDLAKQEKDPSGIENISNDMVRYRIHAGARWKATEKIKGDLKIGFLHAEFEEGEEESGFSIETDLSYALSDITSFHLVLYRDVIPSTRVERETGDYYIFSGGEVGVNYSYFDPLCIKLRYQYNQKDFPSTSSNIENRLDKRSKFEGALIYAIRETIEITLDYQYKKNDSSVDTLSYQENRFSIGVSIHI